MPMIPSERPLISMDVPGSSVNPGAAGAVQQALAGAGDKLTNVSLGLLNEVTKSEAIQASSRALFEDDYATADQMRMLKTKYSNGYVTDDSGSIVKNPDGTPRTITQDFRDWANNRYQSNFESMPSKMAQDIYSQRAGAAMTDSMTKVRSDELILRTQSFKDDQTSQLKFGLNRLDDTPDVSDSYRLMDRLHQQVMDQKGSLLSGQDAYNAEQTIKKEVPQSLMNGMITQVISNPKGTMGRGSSIQDAMDVLHGNDPISQRRKQMGLYTISDSMDPDQKAKFEQRLLELNKVASSMDISDLRKDTQNAVQRLGLGDRVPIQPYLDGWSQARQNHDLTKVTDFDYAENVGQLVAHDAANSVIRSPDFLLASPQVKAQMIAGVKAKADASFRSIVPPDILAKYPSIGGLTTAKIINEIDSVASQSDALAKKDFVSFAQFHQGVAADTANVDLSSPQTLWKTGAYLKDRNSKLDSLGNAYFGGRSPDFRLISKDESQNMGGYFKDPTVAYGNRADGLKALYSADSKHYASIVNQMVKDNSVEAAFRIAPVTGNRLEMQDFFRTMFDGKAIREDSMKVAEPKGYKESDFDAAVQNAAGAHLQAMAVANTDSALAEQERSSIRNVITTKAMDLYRQEGGAQAPSYYAQKATETLLDSKQSAISVGGTFEPGARSFFIVPKFYQGRQLTDSEQTNARVNRSEFFRSNDGIKSTGAVPPAGTEDIAPDKFYEQVASTGQLTQAADGNGYNLKYYDRKANKYVMAFTANKDRDGEPSPVYISTSDLIKTPASLPGRPNPDGKSFMQKMLDAFHFEVAP